MRRDGGSGGGEEDDGWDGTVLQSSDVPVDGMSGWAVSMHGGLRLNGGVGSEGRCDFVLPLVMNTYLAEYC